MEEQDFNDFDDTEDNDLAGTEMYPADHELVEDPESLAGEEVDDSFLDEDGDGIDDRLQDGDE